MGQEKAQKLRCNARTLKTNDNRVNLTKNNKKKKIKAEEKELFLPLGLVTNARVCEDVLNDLSCEFSYLMMGG